MQHVLRAPAEESGDPQDLAVTMRKRLDLNKDAADEEAFAVHDHMGRIGAHAEPRFTATDDVCGGEAPERDGPGLARPYGSKWEYKLQLQIEMSHFDKPCRTFQAPSSWRTLSISGR